MDTQGDIPRFVPNYFPPLLPALYAWQVHGWPVAAGVYILVFAALVGLGWTFLLRGWSLKWLKRARIALILVGLVAVAASATRSAPAQAIVRVLFANSRLGYDASPIKDA